MTRIAIIVGSTRPGRNADSVARWVHEHATRRSDAAFELVDLADHDLPHLDEPMPAALSRDYRQPHTQRWSATIERFDAFVFVTPEYNHSSTAVLKNAIDFLFHEWSDKAAGFVSYGLHGGTRAVEHLRLVMAELKVADVRTQVALSLFNDFEDMTTLRPGVHQAATLTRMLDELVAWGGALKRLRDGAASPMAT
jgi:NAD(P)H-dependent FMN reductase